MAWARRYAGYNSVVREPARRLLLLSRHSPARGKVYVHFKARTSRTVWDEWQGHASSKGLSVQGLLARTIPPHYLLPWLSMRHAASKSAAQPRQGSRSEPQAAVHGEDLWSMPTSPLSSRCPSHSPLSTWAPAALQPHTSPQRWGSARVPPAPRLPRNSPTAIRVPHHLTRCLGWPVLPGTARKGVPPSWWRGSARLSPAQDVGAGDALWMSTVRPWHGHSRAFQSWGEMCKNAGCITHLVSLQCPVLNCNIKDLKKYKNSGTFKIILEVFH